MMGKGSGLFSLLDYLPYIKPPFCSSAIGVNKREMIFWGDLVGKNDWNIGRSLSFSGLQFSSVK